jgi:hypothetical protein
MDRNEAKRSGNANSVALDQISRRTAQSLEDFFFSPEAFVPSRLPLAVCDNRDPSNFSMRHTVLMSLLACSTMSYRFCSTDLSCPERQLIILRVRSPPPHLEASKDTRRSADTLQRRLPKSFAPTDPITLLLANHPPSHTS